MAGERGFPEFFMIGYCTTLVPLIIHSLNEKDLQWIRHSYVMHLMMTWDKEYYDADKQRHTLPDFVKRGKDLYGGDDIISIWPTWPTLGLDQRNQFDLFSDLPGGTAQLRKMTSQLHQEGTKLFVSYNPWTKAPEVKIILREYRG